MGRKELKGDLRSANDFSSVPPSEPCPGRARADLKLCFLRSLLVAQDAHVLPVIHPTNIYARCAAGPLLGAGHPSGDQAKISGGPEGFLVGRA